MGWDPSRPVPWRRLVKEWLIYAAIMSVVFALLLRGDGGLVPIIGGLVVSLPLYLLLGFVLAKFGYQRKTLADLRTPRASPSAPASADEPAGVRARPAPTRRTSGGANRPASRSRSKGRRR